MSDEITSNQPPSIDFWFEFGSNYSYLSAMRIEEAAAQRGVVVRWRPFLLGPIFQSFGWSSSPFVLQKAKGAYVWKEWSASVPSTAFLGTGLRCFRARQRCP